jgi:hypothetical protein
VEKQIISCAYKYICKIATILKIGGQQPEHGQQYSGGAAGSLLLHWKEAGERKMSETLQRRICDVTVQS